MSVKLRPVQGKDMDAMYGMLSDPDSRRMAPFVALQFEDRAAFDAEMVALESDPSVLLFAVVAGNHFVGACMSFDGKSGREVFYWIRRLAWGRGISSEGLARLLEIDHTRPMFARVTDQNDRALAVLAKLSFTEYGRQVRTMPDGTTVTELTYVKQ